MRPEAKVIIVKHCQLVLTDEQVVQLLREAGYPVSPEAGIEYHGSPKKLFVNWKEAVA